MKYAICGIMMVFLAVGLFWLIPDLPVGFTDVTHLNFLYLIPIFLIVIAGTLIWNG